MKEKMKNKLIVLIASIFLSTPSQAEMISMSIPSFVGQYEFVGGSRAVPFDMGVSFSSISSASIKLTALGVDGLAEVCTTSITGLYAYDFIYNCMDYRESPKAFYRVSSGDVTESGNLVVDSTGWNTTSVALFETDQLLDGKGVLNLGIGKMYFDGHLTLAPFLHIQDVSIIIDGIVASDTAIASKDCIEVLGTGTVSSSLDLHIPLMVYESPENNENIWIDLEYLGSNKEEKHVWGLKELGENQINTCSGAIGTGTILSNTDFFMPSMNLGTLEGPKNIWAKLKFLGRNSTDQQLWGLKDYGFNQ